MLMYSESSGTLSGVAAQRVLIVEDDTLVRLGLKAQLEQLGHSVVGEAAKSDDAVALFRSAQPTLVLVDIRLDDTDGIELARTLLGERAVPIVIVSAFSEDELIHRAGAAGVFGYLIKPIAPAALAAQIEVAMQRFSDQQTLLREKEHLAQTLETRKLMDRAKGILMKRLNLSEPDAHKRLQQESQRRRTSLAEVARKIIESDELLSDS